MGRVEDFLRVFRDAPFVDVQRRDDELDRHRAYDVRIAPDARVRAVRLLHRQAGDADVLRGAEPQVPYPGQDNRDVGADDEIGLVAREPRVEERFAGRVGDQRRNPPSCFERVRLAEEGPQKFLLHPFVEPVGQDEAQPGVAPIQAGLHGQLAGMEVVFRHVREPRRFQAHADGDAAEAFPVQIDLPKARRKTAEDDARYPAGRENLREAGG